MFRAHAFRSVVSVAALGLVLGAPIVVSAQPRPPAAPPPDPEAVKKLEQRVNDLEAKLAGRPVIAASRSINPLSLLIGILRSRIGAWFGRRTG